MIYLLNTNLRSHKPVSRELQQIRGLNKCSNKRLMASFRWNPRIKINNLSRSHSNRLIKLIEFKYKTGSQLSKLILGNIKASIKLRTYKGTRHVRKLPCNGQRTRTNAKNARKVKKG
jgi:small subunit ribosomal protein S13